MRWKILIVALIGALGLGGCGKGIDHLSPKTIAERLTKSGAFELNQQGFSIKKALICEDADKGDPWRMACRALLADNQRTPDSAFVTIRLYDHDVSFDDADAPLKKHVDFWKGEWTMSTSPDVTLTPKGGKPVKLSAACHQALGDRNSAAYCTLAMSKRVVLITGVNPAKAGTESITIGDGSDDDQDMDRASTLGILVMGAVNDAVG